MSTQSASWYVRGEGNRPAGPYSTEELIESRRAGRLDANTICWCEGMTQWLPLAQVEPLAAAMAPPSPPGHAAAAAARPPAWIGWAIAGGLAAVGAVVAGAAFLWNTSATVKPPGAADRANLATQSRNSPVRDHTAGENHRAETKVEPNAASASAPSNRARPSREGAGTFSPAPLKPTRPGGENTASYDAPPGLREGVDRLLQRLKENHESTGNFSDYRVIIPPEYTGDETEYEIGFLRPGGTLYIFCTGDAGQTWFPLPATNPYLAKIAEEAGRKAAGGLGAEVPQRRGNTGQRPAAGATPKADEEAHAQGPLSGMWQVFTGARFRIDDDGTTAKIGLVSSSLLEIFSGTLTRGDRGPDAKFLTGTLSAVFRRDARRQYAIRVTATVDDPNHLHLRCVDWPVFNKQGRSIGKGTLNETWTRLK